MPMLTQGWTEKQSTENRAYTRSRSQLKCGCIWACYYFNSTFEYQYHCHGIKHFWQQNCVCFKQPNFPKSMNCPKSMNRYCKKLKTYSFTLLVVWKKSRSCTVGTLHLSYQQPRFPKSMNKPNFPISMNRSSKKLKTYSFTQLVVWKESQSWAVGTLNLSYWPLYSWVHVCFVKTALKFNRESPTSYPRTAIHDLVVPWITATIFKMCSATHPTFLTPIQHWNCYLVCTTSLKMWVNWFFSDLKISRLEVHHRMWPSCANQVLLGDWLLFKAKT